MRSHLLLAIFILATIFFTAFKVPVALAGDGDVKLIMDGNTYYLSTDATASSTTATTSTQREATISAEELSDAPPGYADNIGDLINFALQLVMVIALLLVLFMLVSAGIEWITSGGDKGKTESARNKIVAAIVGAIILAASFALVQLVAYVLGFESFSEAIKNIPKIDS